MIPRWRRLTLLALLASAVPAQAALRIHLDPQGLTPDEVAASTRLTEAALGRVPATWSQAQALEVELQWRDDLPAHVSGRALGQRIRLDRQVLAQWMAAGDAGSAAGRRAVATLLHELAHVADRSPQGGWSERPRFRELAGWQARPLRIGRGRNRFADRSPDLYELRSPAEFFAVNTEYYLLDPEYACRRPALHAWFSAQLGAPTLPQPDCDAALPLLQNTGGEGGAELMTLDPARVYEVDYLLAEGNHQPMSRWGHSMLRLVICAPGRAPGPGCRLDLQHHRVLSFRAFVSDVQISSWRGLTGGYPSRLFVLPLDQVIDEYTKIELRGLQSIPLRLSRVDITGLLQRAGQVHWSYDGRYYFVSNNCAVETGKLLQEGVSRLESTGLDRITPRGLLRRLQRYGIADASVLDDHEAALRQGYYFESAAAHYQSMLDVARAALPIPQRTATQWWAQPAEARGKWIAQADLRATAALLLLEQGALRRQELRARDELKRRLLGSDKALEQSRQTLEGLLAAAGVLARPAALADERGYGLPLAAELATLERNAGQLSARARQGTGQLREEGRARLSAPRQQALAATEANRDQLAQRLRVLSREPSASPSP